MTARVVTGLSRGCFGACGNGGVHPASTMARDDAALNGIATRETNCTRASPAAARGSMRARSPWGAIVMAVVVVGLVLAVELWAAHRAPAQDGTVASEVATEVSATLADVAAASILIGPSN
jgi:hypothetical protein